MTTRTFALTGPIELVARTGHGSLHIDAVDDLPAATVTITPRGESAEVEDRTTVELRGSTLSITAPRQGGIFDLFGGRGRDALDIVVSVPSGTPITVSTFTAEVSVTGRCGSADIAAGSAPVNLAAVEGDLRLRFGNGDCRTERVTGSVQCRSGAGAAQFGEVLGNLTAGCGTGRLDVGVVHGAVRFRAGSGGASLGSIHGDVDLASGSGELRIGLPAGLAARLDLVTGSGAVDSQLPISATRTGAGRAVTVRARTGSGDVHLFRAA